MEIASLKMAINLSDTINLMRLRIYRFAISISYMLLIN